MRTHRHRTTRRSTLLMSAALLAVAVAVASPLAASLPAAGLVTSTSGQAQIRRDSMTVTIEPAKRMEVKLVMRKGQKADFEWKTDGAEVVYNLHAEVPTDPSVKAHTYERGLAAAKSGSIVAVFDGVHGWSWRNTGEKSVTIRVKASGQFSELKKM